MQAVDSLGCNKIKENQDIVQYRGGVRCHCLLQLGSFILGT